MDCNKGFSSTYIILKPEDVKFFDLIRILFSTDIEKRKFVDSFETKEESFERRWLIFISIVAQKVLQTFSKPIAWVGSVSEMWLNLLSSNGNFFKLLLNVLKGKVVVPDRTGSSYTSFIGSFDKRVGLDKSIRRGDAKAALSIMASKASYENKAYLESIVKNHWEMEFMGFYDYWNDFQGKATTQVFIFRDNADEDHDTIVVAFRGTEPFDADAWCSDLDISWYEIPGVGRIHGGFMKALGLQKSLGWPEDIDKNDTRPEPLAFYAIRDMLRDILSKSNKTKYILTGHSLGGALAILFPAVLTLHNDELLLKRLDGVYTFGQPRVGDEIFGNYMTTKLDEFKIDYYRFVYSNDIVPRLPYDDKALMFKHFGTCIHYNRKYEAKVVAEEPNKNYFSPFSAIPMMGNAFMELIRSFTIVHSKGPDYKEGGLMRMFRLIGLVVPGIPAHTPQDYVNSTRLGDPGVFSPQNETTISNGSAYH